MEENKIQSYFDLNVWKKAHQLTLNVYEVCKNIPDSERVTLMDQLKRTSANVAINIADGFQKRNKQDKSRLYIDAQNSLNDLYYLLYLTKDLSFSDTSQLLENTQEVQRMLGGLIRSVLGIANKNRNTSDSVDSLIASNSSRDEDLL